MATAPLMPKATAVWLVDNTSLSFEQIAAFCVLHPLEVKAIADGDSAQGIKGMDPVQRGELTREEIEKAEADPSYRMKISEPKVRVPEIKRRGPRYTPVSKRQDKPDGVAWLIRNHPELSDGQIGKLIGTTRTTIQALRERTHWNIANIQPKDPVTLGLTSQRELDAAVAKAAKAAGTVPVPRDADFARDREALIVELRAERDAAAREADSALAAESDDGTGESRPDVDSLFRS